MTYKQDSINDCIDRAAETIGSVWPLHSFVTANPLAGFEDQPFHHAVAEAEDLFGGRGYPHPSIFRQALEDGQIDPDVLTAELQAHGINQEPTALLDEMAATESERNAEADSATETLDRVVAKWLAAFLDQGQANWSMPNREQGFYAAWRELAPYDGEVPGCQHPSDLPETAIAALEELLSEHPRKQWVDIFEYHLAALPGWTGFIKQRTSTDDPWQTAAPISLTEYLAVRLTMADLLDANIEPDDLSSEENDSNSVPLAEIWLRAWEKSYRNQLLEGIEEQTAVAHRADGGSRPAAQLVFCIDTRSEIIRRHIEDAGPYETFGYAGFFGIPMRYQPYNSDVEIDACPPIVDPQHHIADRPDSDRQVDASLHDRWTKLVTAGRKHLKALKNNVVAAFPFVEGGGSAYGAAMAARTLFPAAVYSTANVIDGRIPSPSECCAPIIDSSDGAFTDGGLPEGMTVEEKVSYAETAFDLMGWEEFSRLVVFTGHASQTTNNPFASSLDCGACAGNPGGPNARVLAAICNDDAVQSALRDRGFDIPADTVFLAGEHNTTTDEITLFDGDVPDSHQDELERLREDLSQARAAATAERVESMRTGSSNDSVREVERRAADWAETRPEWGLAGNASFVIGPRELTEDQDLDGRTFLHSYDWTTDPDGDALEAIMTGPLVVTQWINNQYYFATVDNATYGSGSKTTQNPLGNIGVVQGNGGDLMSGLPLQSLMADDQQVHHLPLRLTAVIHAPVERVTDILRKNEQVAQLFDNGWIRLTVVNPEAENDAFHYQGDLEWEPKVQDTATVVPVPTA